MAMYLFDLTNQLPLLAQEAVPRLDSMYWLMLLSRILHILSAIIIVGGLFYLWAVVTPRPVAEREQNEEASGASADDYFGGRRAAWAMWIGIATLLLIATGLWNYLQIIWTHERLASTYHMIAGIKILAGIAVFFLAALLAGRTAAARGIRRNMRLWLSICLIIGILTVVMGSVLRTFPRTEKVDAPAGPTLIAP